MSKVKTLDEYQKLAATTAVYPKDRTLEYLSLGLAAEVGELTGKLAKWYRKDKAYPHGEVLDELGDVLWFVSEFARSHNVSLSSLAQRNIDKLADRYERGVIKGSGDKR
jgi:NTP pyrophosphatase (non-canonical NTP hydrolase)